VEKHAKISWHIDLHVHTRRFSPCAESLDPWRLPELLSQMRLDGIVITEHDHLWPRREIDELNRSLPSTRIYRGVEVSSSNGHFVVIGLERMVGIRPGISARDLIRRARSQQAAVILAHPHIHYSQTQDQLDMLEMPAGIDAIEVASTMTTGEAAQQAQRCARQIGCAMVGGSDAHALSQVGQSFTIFSTYPSDEIALAAAIRNGACRPGRAGDIAGNPV
jgi:predicted metal-dependent phosphoesterase TrpH